ncbi:hypothetical protein HELRODRAFT_110490 [Helobdella robusta]|uniref:Malic enzyme n=1 Tax=Helobdella robusta TaxID=6412 RepID=T1EF28_HELRO|nr:hypothetical protein HELRODRAFT_110490 [Helobdella robusta]ESO07551.1 hypothetical protein HELRODRAFT_110490 [Helobdella robusta]
MAQMDYIVNNLKNFSSSVEKYVHLMNIYQQNEKLFYYLIINKVELVMPIIYTPTIGQICQQFGSLFDNPHGLYVRYTDIGQIKSKLQQWPEKKIKAICLTDGERILGLGDLGANGLGICIGKMMLYTACAKISPHICLPLCIDIGTNNASLLKSEHYKGYKKKRLEGKRYLEFMDEFMEAATSLYGKDVIFHFEDFGNHNAFELLERYKNKYCSFNDDIQGTAAVTLAGLLVCSQIVDKRLFEQKFLFLGAGEAAIGIATLLVAAMKSDGISEKEALKCIWMFDSKGLIVTSRAPETLTANKQRFAKNFQAVDDFEEAVNLIKPDAIIGVAAIAGAFTQGVLEKMASNHKHPIIFALSNPTCKSECTAAQAYKTTKGKCLFASGSPFEPITIKKKVFKPSQCNNAYIFPSLVLGVMSAKVSIITDELFLCAAKLLSKQVTADEMKEGILFPPLSRMQEISMTTALSMIDYVIKNKLTTSVDANSRRDALVSAHLYNADYHCPTDNKLAEAF